MKVLTHPSHKPPIEHVAKNDIQLAEMLKYGYVVQEKKPRKKRGPNKPKVISNANEQPNSN